MGEKLKTECVTLGVDPALKWFVECMVVITRVKARWN
jgi:hypothetical protein